MTIKYLYHWVMAEYHGWRLRRDIAKMRAVGKKHGLPPLDEYTDKQIIAGCKLYNELKPKGEGTVNLSRKAQL